MLFFYIIYFSKNDFYSCFLLTGNIQRSNQFFYRFKTMPVAIIIHPVNHFYRDRWIHEIIVPIWIAVAPANINSTASFQFEIPPKPIIGIFTA